ncbi:LytR/AlgR family response regulator transcription factor [Flavobacterium sp. LB3P21]|uniref:LytR/AlgR family response regulator transcription factor n=1 Tax=Flavobacterium sp. LB3P21 TaxID=3401719 RepID=UPI003AAB7087
MNTKLKCILLDDELPGLTYLKMLCEQFPELEIVKAFNSPEKLLQESSILDFDLCITDIEMPGIDGLTLGAMLKDKLVIFTTAYKKYAVDAFDIDAVDYLVKPVTKERLQKAISKAVAQYEKNETSKEFIPINTDKGKSILYFNQIVYIKSADNDSRDKEVVTENGSLLVLKNINFESLLKQLPKDSFCRINKKEILALKSVQFFNHSEIVLKNKLKDGKFISLILSDTYRTNFLKLVKI